MAEVQYDTVVKWDSTLADVGYADADNKTLAGLAINALKVTTGAPATVANHWLPGAIVQNIIDGTVYQMTGTTASPAWTLVDAGTVGITALTGDVTATGPGSAVATIGALKVTGAKMVTGVGYFMVAKGTNGTTPVNVIAATVPFTCTITGVYLVSEDTTAGTITVADTAGTVCTIAKGTVSGAMVGAASLANTTVTAGNTLTIVSSSAGNANVFIAFTVA